MRLKFLPVTAKLQITQGQLPMGVLPTPQAQYGNSDSKRGGNEGIALPSTWIPACSPIRSFFPFYRTGRARLQSGVHLNCSFLNGDLDSVLTPTASSISPFCTPPAASLLVSPASSAPQPPLPLSLVLQMGVLAVQTGSPHFAIWKPSVTPHRDEIKLKLCWVVF